MSSSEVLASSSTASTPDDGRCVASRQSDGERCTKNVSERWAEFGRYCPTHGKMIKAQRKSEQLAIEACEREARELGDAPLSDIFDDKTLAKIAVAKPKTLAALGKLRGVGPEKVSAFGDDVLEIIRGEGASAAEDIDVRVE